MIQPENTEKPVQIISVTQDHKFILHDEALQSILLHPAAKNRKVISNVIDLSLFKTHSILLSRSRLYR